MEEMKKYLRFLIMIYIKKNIAISEKEIKRIEENIALIKDKGDSFELKYKLKELNTHIDNINENMLLLHNIFHIDSIQQLDELIYSASDDVFIFLKTQGTLYNMNLYDLIQTSSFFSDDDELLKLYKILYNLNFNKELSHLPFYAIIVRLIEIRCDELIPLYQKLTDFELFNPNILCGSSDEPLWTYLPEPQYHKIDLTNNNKKIILNSRTNYYLISNGTDYTSDGITNGYKDNQPLSQNSIYRIQTICDIIKEGDFSTLDTYRIYKDRGSYDRNNPLLVNIFKQDFNDSVADKINDLRHYLLTKEGIAKQIVFARYMTPKRNENIDFYIQLIEEKYGLETEEIKMLKKLRF